MANDRGNMNQLGLRRPDGGSPLDTSPVPAMVGTAAGAFLSAEVPFLGVVLLAFSMRFLMWEGRPRRFVLPVAAFAVGAVALALTRPFAAATMAPAFLVTFCIVLSMTFKRATVLAVSLATVAGALLALVVDTVYAASLGTTARELLTQVFDAVAYSSLGSGIEAGLVADQASSLFNTLWPFVYVMLSVMYVLAAAAGSFLLETRFERRPFPSLASFDAPLWAVGVLAASALLIAASVAVGGSAGYPLSVVGATSLMSVRIIFVLQGFGVVAAKLSQARTGCALRALVVLLLIWVESVLMAVSIVGLLDVWANFRKLPRDASPAPEADM